MLSVTFQANKWETSENDDNTFIHIYGLTVENKRVVVKIPDFKPYVYLELPENTVWTESKIVLLKSFLKERLGNYYPAKIILTDKMKNYYLKHCKFLWLAFRTTKAIKILESIVRFPINITGLGKLQFKVHEQKAGAILQLITMRKVKPAGWITAKQTHKESLLAEYADTFSTADIEIVASYADVAPASTVAVTNPLIISYDLECISGDDTGNTFPKASRETDQVICICATVAYAQDDEDKWRTFALVNESDNKTCPDDLHDGSEIRHFSNEKDLLLGWTSFISEINPDVITGYNTLSFDDKYLSDRATLLGCWPKFSVMGRLIGAPATREERKWNSSAYGEQCFKYMDISGRIHIDMYPVISRDYTNLSNYSLDSVSEHFLGDHKINLPAKDMIINWHKGTGIGEIILYCNKDTILPLKLMKHMNTWLGLTEMANVMMVPIFDLITRGQQIRVFSQIYTMAFDMNIVCTDKWSDYKPTDAEKVFVGATVQDPQVGYWENVATFDFASLYPTTIIAYNLCFSSFVPPNETPPIDQYHDLTWSEHVGCLHDTSVRKTKPAKIICGNHNYRFYKAGIKKGIVPMMLEHLLAARANTRGELKELKKKIDSGNLVGDELHNAKLLAIVLDKRQNGYKVAANSAYGGFGSDYSYTPFYPAAASTTAMGRKSIQQAIDFAREFRKDMVLVYGDSVVSDTPILLKDPNGLICIKKVSEISTQNWIEYESFKPVFTEPISSNIEYHVADDGGIALLAARYTINNNIRWSKEYIPLIGWQAWSEKGWTNIHKVIRHKTSKKIYRIVTRTGTVDVTQDHSLLTDTGLQVKPVDVEIGDKLLHGYPTDFTEIEHTHSILGSSKMDLANRWLNFAQQKQLCNIDYKNGLFHIVPKISDIDNKEIICIDCIGTTDDYVYDIETECGNFQAGVGELIVKNTDSCMIHFSTIRDLKEMFHVCEELELAINKIFPKPMRLELEKIYGKYFLLSKKKYIGHIVNSDNKLLSVDKKGVVSKRRDNCNYLRTTFNQIVEMVMEKVPKWQIYEYLYQQIDALLNGKVDLEQLVITKSIKEDYKATNLPHVAVSKKMRERGKYVTSGTRIRYIFVETPGKNDPQYIKAEDPDHYLENIDKLSIDYMYYFEKQLINPLDEVLEVKYGKPDILKNLFKLLKKHSVINAKEYFTPKFKI